MSLGASDLMNPSSDLLNVLKKKAKEQHLERHQPKLHLQNRCNSDDFDILSLYWPFNWASSSICAES